MTQVESNQMSIAKTIIRSILSPNTILILILYVPTVVILLRLQNQVMVLQNRIDSGCTATVLLSTPAGQKAKAYLSYNSPYNSSENDFQVAPLIVIMEDFYEAMKYKEIWKSEPFLAFERGYLMYLSVYPAGYDEGEGSHVSVYLHLMKGPYDDELEQSGYWPLRGTFTIDLLNVNDYSSHNHSYLIIPHYYFCMPCTFRVTEGSEAPEKLGHPKYISHVSLLYSYQPFYDSLHFQVSYSSHRNDVKFKNTMMLEVGRRIWGFLTVFVTYLLVLFFHLKPDSTDYSFQKHLIMTILTYCLLSITYLVVVIWSDYKKIDDSISASLYCILYRLQVILLCANIVDTISEFYCDIKKDHELPKSIRAKEKLVELMLEQLSQIDLQLVQLKKQQ